MNNITLRLTSSFTIPQTIRHGVMILLALFLAHFVAYQKLPFQENYQFPLQAFLVILGFGAFFYLQVP